MGLIGIRYGKVVHRPSCPAWARIACVLRAARTSPNRIAAATDHRFMVLCFALSMSILSSSRRVIPALRAPTRHGLKVWEKIRCTKYTPHGHPASLLLIRTMPPRGSVFLVCNPGVSNRRKVKRLRHTVSLSSAGVTKMFDKSWMLLHGETHSQQEANPQRATCSNTLF